MTDRHLMALDDDAVTAGGNIVSNRYAWERIIRRLEMPDSLRCFALILATYGNDGGNYIRPGDPRLSRVMRRSRRTVIRQRQALIDRGLIERVEYGSRREKHADTYRLTLPPDVLETPGILDPDERGFQ